MPVPTPASNVVTAGSSTISPTLSPQQSISWTMLPTLEEFGARRPFDATGRPPNLGGPEGQAHWPQMSRTLTHVSLQPIYQGDDKSIADSVWMERLSWI